MKVKLVSTEEELQGLKEQWNRLVSSNPSTDYVFYSWEWFFYSWKYAGSPELFVVIALENDELVGILPLLRTTVKRRGLKVRSLAFCPNGNTPRNDIYVSSRENNKQIIESIFEYLREIQRKWDMIQLANIEQSTVLYSELTAQNTTFAFSRIIETTGRTSPYANLASAESFDDYLLKHIKPRRRTQIRHDIKRLDNTSKPWFVKHYTNTEQYADGNRYLMQVRERSWKSTPSKAFRNFVTNVCHDSYFDGKIHIAILFLEDVPIAGQFYLLKNGKSHLCLVDHDQAYHESLTPGSNLTTFMLQFAFEQHWSMLDFAGDAYVYKKRLSTDIFYHSTFQIFHSGLKSRLIHWGKTSVLPWIRKLMAKKEQSNEQLNEQKASSEKTG